MPSPEFYQKLAQVSSAIGARRPEDLLLVLAAETNYTLDPASTSQYRPNVKPKSWADLKEICATPGTGRCGALGLNTLEPEVARAIGMSSSEWWSLPDKSPEENLDYVQRYFLWVKAQLKNLGPYDDAFPSPLALYIANAAYGVLFNRLRPETVVYNEAQTRSNPGLDYNHDGKITIQDIDDTIRYAVFPNAKKWLAEYAAATGQDPSQYTGTGAAPYARRTLPNGKVLEWFPEPWGGAWLEVPSDPPHSPVIDAMHRAYDRAYANPSGVGALPAGAKGPYVLEPTSKELDELNARRSFMQDNGLALGIATAAIIITASSALAMIVLHHKESSPPRAGEPRSCVGRLGEALTNPIGGSSRLCPMGSRVQSLLFHRDFFSPSGAKRWARSHGYRAAKVDVTKSLVRLRQEDPSHFQRLRTVPFGKGVRAVVGWAKC